MDDAARAAGLAGGGDEAAWAAAVARARVVDRAGDRAGAMQLLREVAVAARGSGTRPERAAWSNLAFLCLNDGREAEALLAARRAQALMRSGGDAWGEVLVLDFLGHLHGWAEAGEDVAAAADALEALGPRVQGERSAALRSLVARHRAVAARLAGDADRALAHLSAAEADLDAASFAGIAAGLWLLRVAVLLDAGRSDEARALRGAGVPPAAADSVELAVLEVRLAVHGPDAEATVERALAHVAGHGASPTPPARRLRAAVQLAAALRERPGLDGAVRRAYDAAAGAALERLVELESFRRALEPGPDVHPDDLGLLDEMRQRLLRDHASLAAAVAERLGRPGGDAHLTAHLGARDGLVCVCAWCQRVRGSEGRWLPVQQFLPLVPLGHLSVTHGLCEDCRARLRVEGGAVPTPSPGA